MTPAAKTSLRLISLCAALSGSVWLAITAADFVQARTSEATRVALGAAGYDWAEVKGDGLVIELSGLAPDETTRFRALAVAGRVTNPANLRDSIIVEERETVELPSFRLEILRNGPEITAHGLVPSVSAGDEAVIDQLARFAPDTETHSLVTESQFDATDTWRKALDVGMLAAASLENSRVVVTPESVAISGLAETAQDAQTLRSELYKSAPNGLRLTMEIRSPRPVVSPFIARFQLDESGGSAEACSASTAQNRDLLQSRAEALGFVFPSPCIVALGSPDAGWEAVVMQALEALARLKAGTLTVADLNVTLLADASSDADDLARALSDLSEALPVNYTLNAPAVTLASSDDADSASRFVFTRSPEGLVNVRGPVPNDQSREIVESVARAHFPADSLHVSLRAQPDLPDGWSIRVLATLEAFANLHSGAATVTPALVELKGSAGTPSVATDMAAGLTAALGETALYTLDVAYESALAPEPTSASPVDCIASIDAIQSETKITFEPGKTELDIAGLRTVREIAEILRLCADAEIEVGGHTDSQGREEMNQKLSQARANAVMNALVAERILTSNLTAVGYGEASPIGDNETVEGREANRRIEFKLRSEDEVDGEEDVETAENEEAGDGQE